MSKITITAALPYANGPVHIGHLAGVYIPADIHARVQRLRGEEVLFICGSDEHGVPITLRARKEGVTSQDVVDRYHKIIGDSFRDLGISFDIYSRTSNQTHKDLSQAFFKNLYDKGAFREIRSEQYFDEQAGQFLADRYIVGTCPSCKNEGAYGDQCEKCGSTLSPTELLNPKSALSGTVPVMRETINWYLPLDEIQESFLNEWIGGKSGWKSNVLGQCKSWLNEGLRPRAMTRDLEWGVPVPLEGADGKVLYVWFEAPIGYISATKELRPHDWEQWWTGDSKLIHFIGKDNIVFHCIIFPAMLHLRGDGYVLPEQVPANEFLNLEGQKISTSRNWAVWLNEYLEEMPDRKDELRYVLTSIAPETKDSEFTWKDYQTRVNSELVGILGNFANRVLVLMQKYYEGVMPTVEAVQEKYRLFDRSAVVGGKHPMVEEYIVPVVKLLGQYQFRDAQFKMMELARLGNKFLADHEPWKLIKTDADGTAQVLSEAVQVLYNMAMLMEPFMPEASGRLLAQLQVNPELETRKDFWMAGDGVDGVWFELSAGHQLGSPGLLFQKIEDDVIEVQISKLQAAGAANAAAVLAESASKSNNSGTENDKNMNAAMETVAEIKPEVTYDDFAKLDLRVATVVACEKVEKADKLLKLTLEVGAETRTVVSGIALHFQPEEVVGKQVLLLANLAPRKMRGIESQGMILMAEDADGKLLFMSPSNAVASGSGVS
ncbi:MAG: methionine--tRNA ligase [Bacteroidetes bacterium]|nr:methionine--tRNA ligase [Bacteroidota bacterium]MDA1224422.1 methionine--tRNA ligase [Bacteroidota bacterium]